ncbi:enoyl-CoA hydratase-related protein [Conexibacter sp. CPCC 206217]|uniref:enoyl-CoA hydratase-related protein n=1 Tax=Conexibacter sp. CPCC 206217 TaxID=3064574 RepID=UPI00271A3253|nr:enoyl-CoA hydratase-related protein [Conexibacter sp. CPCC 206217]MDO8212240.1 enoyl-CoA hydratase-related protein [Conexibacter sp. CPCC 206217]
MSSTSEPGAAKAAAPDASAGDEPLVLYDVAERVATVTLNRPSRLNAWTPQLGLAYHDALARAGADPGVRAIVVTGAGRGFCAGADMGDLNEISPGNHPEIVDDRRHTFVRTLPKPVIAAVNGAAAGMGLMLAAMCDVRIAAEGAKLTTAFARRGLIAEHGLAWLLTRLVGPAAALDLLLSARVVLAEEALQLGLVNRVVGRGEALDAAWAYARELATHSSPASMAVIKRQVQDDLERGLDAAYAAAEEAMYASLDRPDLAEGVASFTERRAPDFPPLG